MAFEVQKNAKNTLETGSKKNENTTYGR